MENARTDRTMRPQFAQGIMEARNKVGIEQQLTVTLVIFLPVFVWSDLQQMAVSFRYTLHL